MLQLSTTIAATTATACCCRCVLAVAPSQFLAAALSSQPSSLQACFARLMGVALLYRGLVAQTLQVRPITKEPEHLCEC
jgi:hypothetical protein